MNQKKVVVGMSGGVDSSVAAYLLKQEGYEVIGVTMDMGTGATQVVSDAKAVAQVLDIPHYVLDFSEDFRKEVMDYFVGEYLRGRTPNPCNMCNRHIKWEALMQWATEHGASQIATGHYARITRLENGRYAVSNSVTATKDQTYALCNLTQQQLADTKMPVGDYPKEEIRKIAESAGLPVAHKADSQDICFIPDGDYGAFLQKYPNVTLPGAGNYVDKDGTILGRHEGITHYTIGQRKGLNLAMGHPVFVTAIRPKTNEVVIGESEDLFTTTVHAKNINYMGVSDFTDGEEFLGKIRYAHKGDRCFLYHEEDGIRIEFKQPVRAVTPGQFVVLYRDEYVALAGTIEG